MAEVQPPLYVGVDGQIGADELGLPLRDLFGEGVLDAGDMLVSAPGGMSVRVAAGAAYIRGDDSDVQPTYRVRNDGNVDLAVAAADASNPRKDLVIAEVLDAAFAGASFAWRLRVVQGVAAAVPAEPALPNTAVKLAVLDVPAAAVAIDAGDITDTRTIATVGGGDARSAGTMEVLYDAGAGGVTQVDIPDIDQDGTHLLVITNLNNGGNTIGLRINDDAAGTYRYGYLLNGALTATSSVGQGVAALSSDGTTWAAPCHIWLPDYSRDQQTNKGWVWTGSAHVSGPSAVVANGGGMAPAKNPVTKLSLLAGSAFGAGSRVTVYKVMA